MSLNRTELAAHLLRLSSDASWRHYVETLQLDYNRKVESLLTSDHPDEAKRGECRAYLTLLKQIANNQGNQP